MAKQLVEPAFYSVLRWRGDATRDEARNVAVILTDTEGQIGGIRSAPISAISSRLHEQGIVDAIVAGLAERFQQESKPTVVELRKLHGTLQRSLYLTEPRPVIVTDVDSTIGALYRAYVAPRGGGSSVLTKGKVLDRVVESLRRQGLPVRRGVYVSDFIFDLVVDSPKQPAVAQVLSFATAAKNWVPVEHDAGHFIYARDRVGAEATAFIEPPNDASHPNARTSHERILRWYEFEKISTRKASEAGEADGLLS